MATESIYPIVAAPCLDRLRRGTAGMPPARAADLIAAGRLQPAAELAATVAADPVLGADASLAIALAMYLGGEAGQATHWAAAAADLRPDPASLTLLGACHLRQSRVDDAVAALRAALGAAPGAHVAHALLWSCIERRGELHRSIAALKDYLVNRSVPTAPAPSVDIEHTTLAIVDCVTHDLAARAMAITMAACRFEHAVFISDLPPALPGVEAVVIPRIGSAAEYSHFMLKRLVDYVNTDHVLVIQWDGYVLDAGAWSPEFLLYDYIGAPWQEHADTDPRHRVGNGGFSLRSRALLETLREPEFAAMHPEDFAIGRAYRDRLERDHGLVIAPLDVASRFAFEHVPPPGRTFGFHGVPNLARATGDPVLARLDFLFG